MAQLNIVPANCDEASCPVQLEPYENPVVLVNCGHTFSEVTINTLKPANNNGERLCPTCRTPIALPPQPNYALRQIMNTKGTPIPKVYELFCIDVSTSMWYSDYIGPLAAIIGESRLKIAQEFCSKIATARQSDVNHHMGLMTFGTNISLKCDFGSPAEFKNALSSIEPIESKTRIFDTFEDAVNHLRQKENCFCRLYMLTDGGENFSSAENKAKIANKLNHIVNTAKQLKMATFVFNVGGDIDSTRRIADTFHATFKDLNSKNFKQMANDLCMVEFPNRAQELKNLLKGTEFATASPNRERKHSPNSRPNSVINQQQDQERERMLNDLLASAPAAPALVINQQEQVIVVPITSP